MKRKTAGGLLTALMIFAVAYITAPITSAAEEEVIAEPLAAAEEIAAAEEEECPLSVDLSMSLFTSYMWRGLKLYDGASIQPNLDIAYDTGSGILRANGWMHITGDSDNTEERFTEFDGTLMYEYQVGPVTLAAGHLWYTYPGYLDSIPSTNEIFGSIAVDLPLTPTLSVFHDYREVDNQYYELGLSHEFAELWGPDTALTPYAGFGFASHAEKAYDSGGLEQVTIGVSVSVPMGPFALEPSVNYSFKADEETANQLWGGAGISYSF